MNLKRYLLAGLNIGFPIAGFLLLSLFHFLPESYGLMVQWPWVVIWQLGFWLSAIWLFARMRQFSQPFYRLGAGLDGVCLLVAISLVLSTIFSQHWQTSLWYVSMTAGYGLLLYGLLQWLLRSATFQRIQGLLGWLGAMGALAAVVGLILGWQSWGSYPEPINPFPQGHHNFAAGYFTLILPIVFALVGQSKGWRRWLWAIVSGGVAVAFYSTGSRGGALGLLSLVVVGPWLLWWPRSWPGMSRSWRTQLGIVLGAIALLTLVFSQPRVQLFFTGGQAGNTAFRLFTIQTSLAIWRDYPWVGIGPGNLLRLYDIYRPIEAGPIAYRVQQAHCTPAQIIAELGLLGLVGYLGMLVAVARLWWQLWRSDRVAAAQRPLLGGLGASLFAYTVSSLTDFQLENIGISVTLISQVAILAAWAQSQKTLLAFPTLRLRRMGSWLLFLLLLGSVQIWAPSDAAMMLARSGTLSLLAGNVQDFYRQWSVAANLVPWNPYYRFQLGAQLATKLKNYDAIAMATDLRSPTPDTDAATSAALERQRSVLALQLAKRQRELRQISEESLARAAAMEPSDELIHRHLGGAILDDQPATALSALRRSAQLVPRLPFTHAMLGSAYQGAGQREAAISALAIEALIQPDYMVSPIWRDPLINPSGRAAVLKSLQLYQRCLDQLSPKHPAYRSLYQNQAVLAWWWLPTSDPAVQAIRLTELSPIVQAIILADRGQAEAALAVLATQDETLQVALVRAWIDPTRYLDKVKQRFASDPVAQIFLPTLSRKFPARDWLQAQSAFTQLGTERVGFFSYRNTNGPDRVEIPRPILISQLVQVLELFHPLGLLPVYDRTIVAAQQEWLQLPRPKRPRA